MIHPMSQPRKTQPPAKRRIKSFLEINPGTGIPPGTPEPGTPEAEEAIARVRREGQANGAEEFLDILRRLTK
jgi:hypothetical protein